MKRRFTIDALTGDGIDEAIKGLEEYQRWLNDRAKEIVDRLAERGVTVANMFFSTARYDGVNDVEVSIEEIGETARAVLAKGESVLFIEFGSGVTLGYGHPQADEFGMGPGTYPDGKGHWDDPGGWYLPKSKGGGHTFGNPPNAAMYSTGQELRNELERIVREVFATD